MKNFKSYSSSLLQYIENSPSVNDKTWQDIINLDTIDLTLRSHLSAEAMKEAGSFFTGQALATKTVNCFNVSINEQSRVIDVACGAGNLLIECSRHLAVKESLLATLQVWGDVLRGFDIHESFVECAKVRLILEALRRGCKKDCSINSALASFKHICVKDAMLATDEDLKTITHFIINPPFSNWKPGKNHLWGNGKVNAAAVIFDYYLDILPDSCEVSAILPEVIRSGARYQLLRNTIEKRLQAECKVWGRFNEKTDMNCTGIVGDPNF